MFSKLFNIKAYSSQRITIQQLLELVHNNPQKKFIEDIRSEVYKSERYQKLKKRVNCIMPHGIFNSLSNSGFMQSSGYLFYDIDNLDTIETSNDTKKRLMDEFPICFIQRSISNRGFNFLIKLDDTIDISNDTFCGIYCYVRSLLLDKGFNIDMDAAGLNRKMNISSDTSAYLNINNKLIIDKDKLNNYLCQLNSLNKSKISRTEETMVYSSNDTFLDPIPVKDLLKIIKIKTEYENQIDGTYKVDEIEYHDIRFQERIPDGLKRKTYYRIINSLFYLNPNINLHQVYSFLYFVNENHTTIRMSIYELRRMCLIVCNNISKQKEVKVATRTKKIHFNKSIFINKNKKREMGAKINGILRSNNSITLIQKAKEKLLSENIHPTQSKVVEYTGLSIATVKRNWKKDIKELPEFKIENDLEVPEVLKPIIDEDEFFGIEEEDYEVITFNYKGIEDVEIKRKKSDLNKFKEEVNHLQMIGYSMSYTTLEIIKNKFDKYVFEYMAQSYLKKHKKV